MRTESDFIGSLEIEDNAFYGINAHRARHNFPDLTPFHIEWYKAIGLVKQAAYITIKSFNKAITENHSEKINSLKITKPEILDALTQSAIEVSQGNLFSHFIVPAIQGGAGTSINMNINEIITNNALVKMGHKAGNYTIIDPIEHANQYQSTNDVVPTALTVAALSLLNCLEAEINLMRNTFEKLETKYRNALRIGYTQMQQAVPSSYGMLFSSYNDTLSRDWWRVSKCFERIKVVNLGGGATGSGMAIPRFYIMEVVPELKKLSRLPLTQSENLTDTTSNCDVWVEVHAILKAHAVNLEKIASDLRLLASDIAGNEIMLPSKQVGSSIMPGKINPVIPEFVISMAHKIYANDSLITNLASQGTLELNAYIPTIGHALLESIKGLIAANKTINQNLLQELSIDTDKALHKLYHSPAICTAISPVVGYNKAAELSKYMHTQKCSIQEANNNLNILSKIELNKYLQPSFLLQKGFSVKDIL